MSAKRIMIVDDDVDLLNVLKLKIKTWGYETVTVLNGKDAVIKVENKEADMIVLDYLMPEMDGIDTLREIRKIDADIPVVILTSSPDMYSIEGTESLGIQAYVPKSGVFSDAQDSLRAAIDMAMNK